MNASHMRLATSHCVSLRLTCVSQRGQVGGVNASHMRLIASHCVSRRGRVADVNASHMRLTT